MMICDAKLMIPCYMFISCFFILNPRYTLKKCIVSWVQYQKVYNQVQRPAFVLTALLKLKADKDNPIQIPIGVAEFRHDLQDFLSSLRK